MHSEKMLTKLYDLDKMQEGLMTAHNQLDLAVARCTVKPLESGEERLEYLFKLYGKMKADENRGVNNGI